MMKRTAMTLVAASLMLAGCGGSGPTSERQAGAVGDTTTTMATAAPSTTTTTTVQVAGNATEITTSEGWQYRVIVGSLGYNGSPSQDGCVKVAAPGQTNLWWAIRVENLLADRPAPIPPIHSVGLNLNAAGTAVQSGTSQEIMLPFERVTVEPSPFGMCGLRHLVTGSKDLVPAGGSTDFIVTAGPVSDPIPTGTQLLLRWQPTPGSRFEILETGVTPQLADLS